MEMPVTVLGGGGRGGGGGGRWCGVCVFLSSSKTIGEWSKTWQQTCVLVL